MAGMLDGKAVLVTGASKGIGQVLAQGLARHGASVIVNYKTDQAGAEETTRAIVEAGGTAHLVQADVADPDQVRGLIDETCEQLGGIDVLVNNAGRTRFGPASQVTIEDFEDLVGTNLRGPFFASVAAAEHMRDRGGGTIVNISTCAASVMVKYHSIYTMSKGGLEALTRQLAVELAPEVRVNAISPGPVGTERNRQYDPDFDANWGPRIPLGRVCYPEDYIGPTVFLASDQSAFLTGEVLHVDGGWTLVGDTPSLDQYDFESDRQRG